MSGAPYGYRYVKKSDGGNAYYEVVEAEAAAASVERAAEAQRAAAAWLARRDRGLNAGEQDEYLQQTDVIYDPGNGVEMIITQKYINFFLNGGWEAFYNHLRTRFPVFSVDGGGVLNNGQVPKRWMYPQQELQLNSENVEAAIQRQYPEGDNINGVMWLLKAE